MSVNTDKSSEFFLNLYNVFFKHEYNSGQKIIHWQSSADMIQVIWGILDSVDFRGMILWDRLGGHDLSWWDSMMRIVYSI